jgi:hypothetical protein
MFKGETIAELRIVDGAVAMWSLHSVIFVSWVSTVRDYKTLRYANDTKKQANNRGDIGQKIQKEGGWQHLDDDQERQHHSHQNQDKTDQQQSGRT